MNAGSKLLAILLIVILSSKAYGSAEPQLEFAEYLFEKQDFYQAITEYKRFIFYHLPEGLPQESQLTNTAYYKIGLCYKYGKKYNLAQNFFEKVLDNHPDNNLKRVVCLEIAKTYIDEKNFEAARFELEELIKDNPLMTSEIYYWKGISYLREYKWKAAQVEFSHVTEGVWLDSTKKFSPYIEEALHLPYRSEKQALLLSTIIPGSGQMYAGRVMDGIISFIFNASMAYFAMERVKADDHLGAGLIVSVGLLRFYHGGRQNALQAARGYNEQMNSKILEEIKCFGLSD
ncbi:MAG: tetratricopeptide repeat protein [bacterium]